MFTLKDKYGHDLSYEQAFSKLTTRFNNYILDFKLMILRWVGHIPSHFIRKSIYILSGIRIGKGSTIHMWANFNEPKGIKIGEDSIIGDHCFLDGRSNLIIGDHVAIASQVLIYNSEHDINSEDFKPILGSVNIEDYVFIGPRSIILPDVKIGKGAVVAAGAVITKDVPPNTIVGGVPAIKIGKRNINNYSYKLGRARLFQ